MRVHDLQAYKKIEDCDKGAHQTILELREILLSFQAGLNHVMLLLSELS